MAIEKKVKIQIRQGQGHPGTILDTGELGYDKENKKVYIGENVGQQPIELAKKEDIPAAQTFKTINGEPITGSGDIAITGSEVDLNNYYDKSTTDLALSTKADKSELENKQDKLIAGTNITITGSTISATGTVYDDTTIKADIAKKADKSELENFVDNAALQQLVETEMAEFVNSSPETLETLNELSEALGNDSNLATTISTQLGEKATKTELNALIGGELPTNHNTILKISTELRKVSNNLSQKGGISAVAIELLGNILEKAVFVDDEKDNIAALVEELAKGGGGGAVVKKPTITQNASTYMVTMVSEGNSIYYTTNGDAPTKTSILYTEPFSPDEDCTIKAVAIDADDNMSVVVSLAVKVSDIITFADENLAKVAIAKTTESVEVNLPDGTTKVVKGFGWDTDGSGFVQRSEAAQKTGFDFNSNNWITSFNEAKHFTEWKIGQYTLYGVSNLESINLPPVENIGANEYSFNACAKLKKIIVNEGTNRLERIHNCAAITELSLPSTLTYFGGITNGSGVLKDTTLVVPENVTNFPSIYNTNSISRIKHLNPNLNTIDMASFSYANSNRHVWLAATTPPTLTGVAQGGGIGTVYVPDALVDTYKAAEGWSTITVKGHSEWIY